MDRKAFEDYYQSLFDDNSKIEAFDKIAENYYFCNFGNMQKADFDVLMFSIFLDQILSKSKSDFNAYSDYTLSTILGITQQRVSNFKIKKELRYPYKDFDWRVSFAGVLQNARFDEGKIKVYIPDPNLLLEIKNCVESDGGYTEVTLNSKLLQIAPEYFLKLLLVIAPESEKKELQSAIKKQLEEHRVDVSDFTPATLSKIISEQLLPQGLEKLGEIIKDCIPVAGPLMKPLFEISAKLIKQQNGR